MEGERWLIRPFRPSDGPRLAAILGDEEVMRFIEPPYTPRQTEAFLRRAGLCRPPLIQAVIWKPTGALIGQVIFHPYDEDRWELGWILAKDFWGKGLAGEITAAALTEAKERGARALLLECAAGQAATVRIAQRLGFTEREPSAGLRVFEKSL